MNREDAENRSGEPLMAPLEEVERRAYPALGEEEPYGSGFAEATDGLLPDAPQWTEEEPPPPAFMPEGSEDETRADENLRRRMR